MNLKNILSGFKEFILQKVTVQKSWIINKTNKFSLVHWGYY